MSGVQARIAAISSQLSPYPARGASSLLTQNPDDVVVCSAVRTPFTKGGRGYLKDTAAADLLVHVLKATVSRSGIDPAAIQDVAVGSVLAPGGGATEFRAAALAAGLPASAAVHSLNRQCSSGLQACVEVAHAIRAGMVDVGVGAGVESMSQQYGPQAVTEFSPLLDGHEEARSCKVPMGELSERMARDRGIKREDQDAFAARSYQRAAAAQREGRFDAEIEPLRDVRWTNPKTGEEETVPLVSRDDGIRPDVTAAGLAKIRPAFPDAEGAGSISAGNASQISDGAAAVLLARRSVARSLGLPVLGKFVSASVVGVPPLLMGIGPWKAIPEALKRAGGGGGGIAPSDVDVFEVNEAFASQCLWCVNELGLDETKVNPNGGAIAFGHPLGCTGARQVATLMSELKRTGGKVGVTSMCVGTGMGMAAVWVRE